MDLATRMLIVGGTFVLAFGLLLGIPMAAARGEAAAAAFLVGGVALFDTGLTLNWLQGVEDGFAEKSLGYRISSAGTPFVLLGAGIVCYGVVVAL